MGGSRMVWAQTTEGHGSSLTFLLGLSALETGWGGQVELSQGSSWSDHCIHSQEWGYSQRLCSRSLSLSFLTRKMGITAPFLIYHTRL